MKYYMNNLQNVKKIVHTFKFEHLLISAIILGIILRFFALGTRIPMYDGTAYMAVGHAFSEYHSFLSPWGYFTDSGTNLAHSTLAPLFPAYLGFFYMLFGFSLKVTQIASFIISILCLITLYLTTKNLFGHLEGLIVTAIFAFDKTLIFATADASGENLLVIVFALLTWSLLKSLNDRRHILLVFIFTGMFYMLKSHALNLIIMAMPIVLYIIWYHFIYEKMHLLKVTKYLLITGFVIIGSLLSYSYFMSNITIEILGLSLNPTMMLLKLPWTILLISIVSVYWLPELKRSLDKLDRGDYNLLWLMIIFYSLMIWIMTSWIGGDAIFAKGNVYEEGHIRYVLPIFVPILWLVLKETNFRKFESMLSPEKHKFMEIRKTFVATDILNSLKKYVEMLIQDKNRLITIISIFIITIAVKLQLYNWLAIYILFGAISLMMFNPRKRLFVMLFAFLLLGLDATTHVLYPPYANAANDLNLLIQDGDIIAIDDGGLDVMYPYALYPFLYDHTSPPVNYYEAGHANYILSYTNERYDGYELIGEYYWSGHSGIISQTKIFFKNMLHKQIDVNERTPDARLWRNEIPN